jgi:glycosyltransferase involved in cell wall biosynthesis
MKIAIDARLYGTKNRGIGRYVKELVDGLISTDNDNEYLIFLRAENFNDCDLNGKTNFQKIVLDIRWYSFAEQFFVSKKILAYKPDITHFPHFNVPYFFSGKFIVTIHDLIIQRFPDSRATTLPLPFYKLKLWFFKKIFLRAVKKAEQIIVPTEFVKNDLLNLCPKLKNISVIHEGYFKLAKEETLENFNLPPTPYLFYVGSAYPHKNLENLVEAFLLLRHDFHCHLVIAGREDFFMKRLEEQVKEYTSITFRGEVSDPELAKLYKNATALVFPSLYEGFGLPPLEAQSFSLPVVSARSSSLPEVLGDSALYFDPQNIADLTAALKNIMFDEPLREDLIAHGLENIKRFSWGKMVEEIKEIYLATPSFPRRRESQE